MHSSLASVLEKQKMLSPPQITTLLDRFVPESYPAGAYLLPLRQKSIKLFFVEEGLLRIVKESEVGVDQTLYFVKQHCFCTIVQSFTEDVFCEEGIQSVCHTHVLALHRKDYIALGLKAPAIKSALDALIQEGLLRKLRWVNAFHGLDARERYLLLLKEHPDIVHQAPLQYIASCLGITQQSLSRIRRQIL